MTPRQFKAARLAIGLSTAKMASALSDPDSDSSPVSARTIRRWESKTGEVPGPAIVSICYMLRDIVQYGYILPLKTGELKENLARAQKTLKERMFIDEVGGDY
ncbi:MAG: hypothetical protein V3U60_16315 [Gammaproteobacteria bacterium]